LTHFQCHSLGKGVEEEEVVEEGRALQGLVVEVGVVTQGVGMVVGGPGMGVGTPREEVGAVGVEEVGRPALQASNMTLDMKSCNRLPAHLSFVKPTPLHHMPPLALPIVVTDVAPGLLCCLPAQ
jgi:hypothetical protein